jgi:hypothetical protein
MSGCPRTTTAAPPNRRRVFQQWLSLLRVVLEQDAGPAGATTTGGGGGRNRDPRPLAHGAGGPQRLGRAHQAGVRGGSALLSSMRGRAQNHRLYRAATDRGDREDPPALRAVGGGCRPGPTAAGGSGRGLNRKPRRKRGTAPSAAVSGPLSALVRPRDESPQPSGPHSDPPDLWQSPPPPWAPGQPRAQRRQGGVIGLNPAPFPLEQPSRARRLPPHEKANAYQLTTLGDLAKSFVAGSHRELPSHREFQIRGILDLRVAQRFEPAAFGHHWFR